MLEVIASTLDGFNSGLRNIMDSEVYRLRRLFDSFSCCCFWFSTVDKLCDRGLVVLDTIFQVDRPVNYATSTVMFFFPRTIYVRV